MVKYIILFLTSIYIGLNKTPDVENLPEDVAAEYNKLPQILDYNEHVKPILSDKCFACHGPDKAKQKAGLRLDFSETAYAPLPENPAKVAISPKSLEKSEVFHRIISTDPTYLMPPPKSHLTLSAREKAVLAKWIEDGAVYKPHWAFVRPEQKAPQNTAEEYSIDRFIFSRLKQEDLAPSKEADKEILLRRLSLDLTGLPPTIEEIDVFLNDTSPNAYEKQVDRLLDTPHYGEKMATDWLDLARFADSHGYTVDRLRDMSPYRDWVIEAFNKNMPYDVFIQQQLAGDLMPNPTKDMLIATAFNRNHPQNMEGGIVEEEFQTEYVMDRTNTFGDAFLAISVGCARCHDHKYDPISQKNYYELYSFFNNVREAGQIAWNDDLPTPTLMLPDEEKEKIVQFLKRAVFEQEENVAESKTRAVAHFETWIEDEKYKNLTQNIPPSYGLQGFYNFEDVLKNNLDTSKTGVMRRESGALGDKPVFEKRDTGQALLLNGDVYLDLKDVGVFRKSEAFSIGMWAYFPKGLKEGVIFHKSNAERLYNFKGYNLSLKNNKLEITMAHTAPSNAITRLSKQDVPREKWVQLTVTYDGSSTAAGFKLHLDGAEAPMETVIDQLYKDIVFYSKPEPALQVGGWWRGLGFKDGKVDDIVVYNRVLTPFEINILAKKARWESVLTKNKDQLTAREKVILKDFYFSAVDTNVLQAQKALQIRRTALADSTENIPEIMVMQEMPNPKKTYVLQRGQYDALGEAVTPNTPESILPFPPNLPKNRHGLAQWLTDENNPLTARVAVNRFWQNFFGTGLVKTSEDFGNQGELPSHPELLDWLALTFKESKWDIKKINKLIAMSAAYRRDSKTNKALRERDPENRLFARGPANRLSAEMMRDNALAASGLLNKKIGGKSVKPYQPDGLWEINSMHYTQDSTDAIYRRSLYVIVKRSVPNPTLGTFDAPSRSSCITRRQKTNTPLQALVTLNDPTFVEASKVLGEKMAQEADKAKGIEKMYRRLTGRSPAPLEVNLLLDLQQNEYEKFKNNPDRVNGWIKTGLYKIDKNLDAALVAANAVVANTILNSDATLTKR
jgi:Protein of unknown function (DUF1553)/Protein of unknown function (DUF1549)/Concanavalin A-like lectin/glucanases superfamily/Planctomycete cytochrome C